MQNHEAQAPACNTPTPGAADPGELLTLAEVAQILKVSRKTLYTWKDAGKLRFVKIGSLVRITRADLAALITPGDPAPHKGSKPPALA